MLITNFIFRNVVPLWVYIDYRMRQFLYFLLFTTILFSCKKETGEFEINGLLVDSSTGVGLKHTEIDVYETLAGSTDPEFLKTIVTDAEGHYSLNVSRDRFDFITLKVNNDDYFEVEKIIYFGDLTLKEANVFLMATTAKSWAKIHLISTNPGNTISMIKGKGKTDCAECCPNEYQYFNGAFDTTFYCINDGNREFKYTYFLNGGVETGILEGITPSFDTLLLELEF